MPELLLAIDAGTTTARVCVFSPAGALLARASAPVMSKSPAPGRVEQDAEAIWRTTRRLIRSALAAVGRAPGDVAAIVITASGCGGSGAGLRPAPAPAPNPMLLRWTTG